MTYERIAKLFNYLYPTEQIRSFCCNDLYQELLNILSPKICISSKNLKSNVRKENLDVARGVIFNFINSNEYYKNRFIELSLERDEMKIVENILLGYVFYLYCSYSKYSRADIFRDKKSILYCPISILDIL